MKDVTILLWLVVVGVTVLGGLPYLIWMVVTAFKKRWRKLAMLAVAPVLVYGVLIVATAIIDHISHKVYLSNIYDTSVDYGEPIYQYHSDRSFNGDGYSIEIYALPDSIRKRFHSADADLLAHFPKRPSYRDHWRTEHWREAPFDSALEKYLSFALSSYSGANEPALSQHFDDIRTALDRKGTFYSFFTFDHGDQPGDIDMYIVDLEGGRVYEINHNT